MRVNLEKWFPLFSDDKSDLIRFKMADGFEAVKVIDAHGHLMGRLAATVAKLLLQGNAQNLY